MTYANIELKEHDRFGDGIKRQSTIDPFLKDLIEQLALKYPQWTFVETNVTAMAVDKTYLAHRFDVKDKREVLGTIDKDYCGSGYRYRIDNHRIEGVRERGSGMKTIHLKKAIKHVDKFFGKKNMVEKLTEAKQKVQYALSQVNNEKEWRLRGTWSSMESDVRSFVISNYQMFMDSVVNKNSIAKQLEQLPTQAEEFNATQHLTEMLQKDNAFIVFIDGLNYSVQKGKDPLEVKQSDELPDFIRRAVGLLKLVEDNQVVSGVGMRVNETTFLVLPNNVS
jgi:flagellar biosynthesis chaperone FliJ